MNEQARLKAGKNLSRLVAQNFTDGHAQAASGKPVVWVAIGVPIELLKGFDLVIAVPENHSAMCAARKVGAAQSTVAEDHGYSIDLCSYARIDIGTVLNNGQGSPSMGLPKPDLLISDNNNCSLLAKWFDVHHRKMSVPHFVIDVPFCYEQQNERDLNYILGQFHELIAQIEQLTGQKFDIDKVREAVACSNEATHHWKRFTSFAAHRPSGITAFDGFVHMAIYITAFRGTRELAEHFKMLADEVEQRVNDGIFPLPNEKYRLLWDNIAPWHQLRPMSTRLAEMDANIIHATYINPIVSLEGEIAAFEFADPDPLRDLARIQNGSVCPYGLKLREITMSKLIDKFGIDGVVFSSNRSCKPYSLMQMDMQQQISRKHGIPTVMVEVDMADERKYSEAATFTRFEALIETIAAGRAN